MTVVQLGADKQKKAAQGQPSFDLQTDPAVRTIFSSMGFPGFEVGGFGQD